MNTRGYLYSNINIILSLRGISAFAISISHIICTVSGMTSNKFVFNVFDTFGKGVQVFFTISSVVIPLMLIKTNYQIHHFFEYLKKRLIRIYPPFFVSAIILFFYWHFRTLFFPSNYLPSFKDLILNLFYLVPYFKDTRWLNNIYWTLSVEVGYYFFLGIIFSLATQKFFYRLIFYLSFFLIYLLKHYFSSHHLFFFWSFYFLPGIIYVFWINQKISDREFLMVACMSVIVNFLIYDAIDVFIQVIVLLLIHYFSNYSNKYLNFFGEISYSLYLTHVFTGVTVANVLVKYTTCWYEKFFLVVFSTVICVVSAYFYYLWVEKPALRYSKKLKL